MTQIETIVNYLKNSGKPRRATYRQIADGTGLSHQQVLSGCTSAYKRGLIREHSKTTGYNNRLMVLWTANWAGQPRGEEE